jgi:hypothetical protein
MPFERDPLSVRYDPAAGRLLGQAIASPGKWVYTTIARPSPGPRTRQWLRSHGITLDSTDAGGLTSYERAYQRSLYWTLNGGGNGKRNALWSLQREWGPVTARGRVLGIRVSSPRAARLAVQRKPKGEQWWRNADLRSGGQGSPQQRFG